MILERTAIRNECLYGIGVISRTLGVAPEYVRGLIREGVLDARRAGGIGHYRITGASLLAYIDGPKAAGHD